MQKSVQARKNRIISAMSGQFQPELPIFKTNRNTNRKLEDTRMKIVIINGSARKGNTLTAINAFIKGASEKNEIEIIEPDKLNIAPVSYTHLDVYKRQTIEFE